MCAERSYLYGVIPADGPRAYGPIGIGGGEVRVEAQDGIGAVAGAVAGIDFRQLTPEKALQYLAEHQRVLEQVMIDSPVIPVKFGTCARDQQEVLGILQSGRNEFAQALGEYSGKVELDVTASWVDLQVVLAGFAGDEAVVSMKAEIAADGEPTMQQRLRLGQLVKGLLDEKREGVAARLATALRAKWPDVLVNPTTDDSTVLSAAVLIDRSERAEFDRTIDELNRCYHNRLVFRCVGPLPVYSFAMAEVQTVDSCALDAAREALGLGESASLNEIKAAHHRLLHKHHPDRDPDPGAAERVSEISAAYERLEQYAMNYKHTFGVQAGKGLAIVKVRSLLEPGAGLSAASRAA